MKLINGNYLDILLEDKNYDLRQSNNGRWIDQKCTPDVLTIIADCVLEFNNPKNSSEKFTSKDIWTNEYTVNNILDIFKKPSPTESTAKNEYDKFFQQPLELLSYIGILEKTKKKNRSFYQIKEKELLEEIAISERLALKLLVKYISKVIKDSGLSEKFNTFFEHQDKFSFLTLKDSYIEFIILNTPINGATEASRIFTKVINPIAYSNNKLGTERGRLSKNLITYDMLMYNRENFRDINQDKPKTLSRGEHSFKYSDSKYSNYLTIKAMKNVRILNRLYNSGLSEVPGDGELATEVHHIFPKSDHPEIAFYIENLINLTPNQHRNSAHPRGNYHHVDREFQKICLISKLGTIEKSIFEQWGDYDLNNFIFVLENGFRTNDFSIIESNDFNELILKINSF